MPAPLKLDVHVAPLRAMQGAPAQGPGDEPTWSPMSSTLIHGDHDAILVDTLVTFDQVDALADWIKSFGVNVIGIYITHGHADHWIGLSRLLQHFPHARGLATAEVRARAHFEATDPGLSAYWQSIFPGEIPTTPVLPELLAGNTIELEKRTLYVRSIGQGDTEHSTILHIPEIEAVVAGDIVYNHVHMMTGETNAASRLDWIASLNAIQALDPKTVVAGHKRVDAADSPVTIEQTRQYLRDFSQIAAEQHTVQGIVTAMLDRHPDRDNPRALWHSARMAVAKQPDPG